MEMLQFVDMSMGYRWSWEAGKPQLSRMRRFSFLDWYLP